MELFCIIRSTWMSSSASAGMGSHDGLFSPAAVDLESEPPLWHEVGEGVEDRQWQATALVSPSSEGMGDGQWAAIAVGAAEVLLWFEGAGDGQWEPAAESCWTAITGRRYRRWMMVRSDWGE